MIPCNAEKKHIYIIHILFSLGYSASTKFQVCLFTYINGISKIYHCIKDILSWDTKNDIL